MIFLTQPWLLLAAALWVGAIVWSLSRVRGMSRGKRIAAAVVRSTLGVLLILALGNPHWVRTNRGVATIFVLDRSDSITLAEKRRSEAFVQEAIKAMGPEDRYAVIAFGKAPQVEVAPSARSPLAPILSVTEGGASDLASALRLASAIFPEGKAPRIVVLSDGNQTDGDATEPAQTMAIDGIVVDTVTIGDKKSGAEVSALDLQIPPDLRVDQRFEMRAILESNVSTKATLEIDINNRFSERIEVSLVPGKNSILIPQRIPNEGLLQYRVRVVAQDDSEIRNNIAVGFAAVRGKPRILVMQSDPNRSELSSALSRTGFIVEVRGPGQFPFRTADLVGFDAVLLNDIPASAIPERNQKLLQGVVREAGVGLAMIGGEDSFLPGGWYGTPVAEALPVDLNIRQRKTFPSTSVAILVDCSGSMSQEEDGVAKLQLAIKAAERTIQLLGPNDRISVAGSSDGIEWVARGQSLANRMEAIRKVRRLEISGGGIYIGPTIEAAEQLMRGEDSKVRHIIVLADGSDSSDFRDAFERVSAMSADKITTSIVAIGSGSDVPDLKQLAMNGGGNFYLATRASLLPAIFTQDTALMSRSAIEEGNFSAIQVADDPSLRGLTALPRFQAYCLTDGRPLSKTVLKTPKDDPLLVRGQYGLGTTLAFTSDAQSRWARDWVSWEGFDAFWSQTVRSVLRRVSDNSLAPRIEVEEGSYVLKVEGIQDAENGSPPESISARLIAPDGTGEAVELRQVGPGEYQAPLRPEQVGTYLVSVAESQGTGPPTVSTIGFGSAYPAEYRSVGANPSLLARLNRLTAGRSLSDPAEAFRAAQKPGQSQQPLITWLLGLGCILMLLDVSVRRIAFSLPELRTQLSRKTKPQTRPIATTARIQAGLGGKRPPSEAKEPLSPAAPAPTPAPPPAPSPTQSAVKQSQPAATSLLEAKRRRQEEQKRE